MSDLFKIVTLDRKDYISKREYNYVLSVIPNENNDSICSKIQEFKTLNGKKYSEGSFLLYACYEDDKIKFATLDYATDNCGPEEFFHTEDTFILKEIDEFISKNK